MNNDFKRDTKDLSNILLKETGLFLINLVDRLGEESQNISYLIDIVVSAHISSLFNNMTALTEGNKEMEKIIKTFIDELIAYLKKSKLILNIEKI